MSRGQQRTQSRCTSDVVWKDERVSFTVFQVLPHPLGDIRKQTSDISGFSLSVKWELNQMPLGPALQPSSFSSAPGELQVGTGTGRLRLRTWTLWPWCILQCSPCTPSNPAVWGSRGSPPKGMHSRDAGSSLPPRATLHQCSSRRCWVASTMPIRGPSRREASHPPE